MNLHHRKINARSAHNSVFDPDLAVEGVSRIAPCGATRAVYDADDERFLMAPVERLSHCAHRVMPALLVQHRRDRRHRACNTASTCAVGMRQAFSVTFVENGAGDQPAARRRKIEARVVLGTEATVTREYTKALIRDYRQGCDVASSVQASRGAAEVSARRSIDDAASLRKCPV